MNNRMAKNRKSPSNEGEYIQTYQNMNRRAARKNDGLDIAAVVTKDGTRGHGLMSESINRDKNRDYHRVKNFIPDKDLKKNF